MKNYDKFLVRMILLIILIFAAVNIAVSIPEKDVNGRQHIVEISRISREIEEKSLDEIDLSRYRYVINIQKDNGSEFYNSENDYVIRQINGSLYRFDYTYPVSKESKIRLWVNLIAAGISAILIAVMLYIRHTILRPFSRISEMPYELSKGNLSVPVKEYKKRYFGRFLWGIDLLRENLEHQKKRELDLQREKQTLLLSLSHDIKTPLSAIKLYSKALSKGLYPDKKKQIEIAESIDGKADEIEQYVSQIINASRENFLELEVDMGEFCLSDLVDSINTYYSEKMKLYKTEFSIGEYSNFILKGDIERSIEVMQNIIENALKYGDGSEISIEFSREENCLLIAVKNSGCSLSPAETPHIFESFWRGSNSDDIPGSGLGLYICRRLMNKMEGEIFAEFNGSSVTVTAVFVLA